MSAKVIQLMDGKRTFDEIGKRLGIEPSYARAWPVQSSKRKGIGFAVDAAGKVRATFPKGTTVKSRSGHRAAIVVPSRSR